MTADACADLEEELTVDLPMEVVPLRNIGLVSDPPPSEEDGEESTVVEALSAPSFYPPPYDPPLGRLIREYLRACRQRARELREFERTEFADALYFRCRRLLIRFLSHAKRNARYKPWEEYRDPQDRPD